MDENNCSFFYITFIINVKAMNMTIFNHKEIDKEVKFRWSKVVAVRFIVTVEFSYNNSVFT